MLQRTSLLLLLVAALSLAGYPIPAAHAQGGDFTLTHDGLTRTYTLTVPARYDDGQPAPLLIMLHGFASSGKAMRALTGLDELAEREGALVAYPGAADLYWDDGRPWPDWFPPPQPIDDVGFLGALIDDVSARYAVAPARVYLAGFNNGGTMAFTAACLTPERYAGVIVTGTTLWDYHPAVCGETGAPVPLLIVMGTENVDYPLPDPDATTLEDAQARAERLIGSLDEHADEAPRNPAEAAMQDENAAPQRVDLAGTVDFWVDRFGCEAELRTEAAGGNVWHYDACPAGASVTLVKLPGVGGNWPRAGDYALNQFGMAMNDFVASFMHGADPAALDALITPSEAVWGGAPRTYTVYVPPGYDPAEPMPLVVALHGRPGNGNGLAFLSEYNRTAEAKGFIIVYPDGLHREWSYLVGTPGFEEMVTTDDVTFLKLLAADLGRDLAIDPRRMYVTGFSNGGFMTQRMACDATDTFAAFGVVGATLFPGFIARCEDSPPVPILLMHGTADVSVRWEGAMVGDKVAALSVPDTVIFWAQHNGCDPQQIEVTIVPKADPAAPTEVYRYAIGGCEPPGAVLYYVIEGGGHNIPGVIGRLTPDIAGNVNTDITAGDELWAFFEQHTLAQ